MWWLGRGEVLNRFYVESVTLARVMSWCTTEATFMKKATVMKWSR
jgi:hypothetical protein